MSLLSLSRRQLIIGFAAASAFPTLSFKVRAEPVTLTVLAAGAAIVSIISGISGILSDKRKEELLKEINTKLDAIIKNQADIFNEIQSLKIYIDESIFKAIRDNSIIKMSALKDRYEIITSEKLNSANKNDYINLENMVSQTALELGRYDLPAYIAYGTGVSMVLALNQTIGVSRIRLNKVKEVFKRAYDNWLDLKNPYSITSIVKKSQEDLLNARVELEKMPLKIERIEGDDECHRVVTINISGDLTNGFTGTRETSNWKCIKIDDICTRHRAACIYSNPKELNDINKDIGNKIKSMLPTMALDSNLDNLTTPEFKPSGINEVDAMNTKRIAIIKGMNLLARQIIIQEQLEQCQSALSKAS
ncbi:MAG TPA: hypothetical protein VGI71_06790 [Scandinavium sp.]|jgi:hypothetical protein